MLLTVSIIVALLLDRLLGEPKKFHPLIGFGKIAAQLEKILGGRFGQSSLILFAQGMIAWSLAILPITIIFIFFNSWIKTQHWVPLILLNGIGLSFCIGTRSLVEHILKILKPLDEKNIELARIYLSLIVSRDTNCMDENQIISATIESTLENGNDATFAAIFWFAIGGLPAAIAYRLINTLDAMWGYRNEQYEYFGKFAARADDAMNFIPARLTAFSYCLAGQFKTGWQCWQQQGQTWKSPNAGPVMAAGSGALQITIGGDAIYHGSIEHKPLLGSGPNPKAKDINRAMKLIHKALYDWVMVIFLLELLHAALNE